MELEKWHCSLTKDEMLFFNRLFCMITHWIHEYIYLIPKRVLMYILDMQPWYSCTIYLQSCWLAVHYTVIRCLGTQYSLFSAGWFSAHVLWSWDLNCCCYSLQSILVATNTNVSRCILVLGISNLVSNNMNLRDEKSYWILGQCSCQIKKIENYIYMFKKLCNKILKVPNDVPH
jgi:hypothetical protein